MARRFPPDEPGRPEPVNWDELWNQLKGRAGGGPRLPFGPGRALFFGLVVVLGIWLASGTYMVGPGSQGVVRRFGQEIGKTDAGLNYHLPWPIETVNVVDLAGIRRLNVGFRELGPDQFQEDLSEALMLTGDENMVDVHVIVQYRVNDASRFLFKVRDSEEAVRAASEVALRHTVGQHPIDFTLVEARGQVEEETRAFLQQLLDNYESGLLVTQVKLQEVDAPQQVRDAFQDVVRAKEDKERLTREAQGYAADAVPRARGQKEQAIRQAEAYKERRIIRAQGEARRFLSVLAEYRRAPDVTRTRLYLETIETTLSGVSKIVVDPEATSGILPLLPLQDMAGLGKPKVVEGQ